MKQATTKEHLKIASMENLTSVMSATKWDRISRSLEDIQDVLQFRRKDLRWPDDEVRWDGDLYHVFGLSEFIEWLDIRSEDRHLLDRKAREISIPFESRDFGVRIYGYLRHGISVVWAHEKHNKPLEPTG